MTFDPKWTNAPSSFPTIITEERRPLISLNSDKTTNTKQPTLRDKSFFEEMQAGKCDLQVAAILMRRAIPCLKSHSTDDRIDATLWLEKYISSLNKNSSQMTKEFAILLDACEKEFLNHIKANEIESLHPVIILVVQKFRNDVYLKNMDDHPLRARVDKRLKEEIGGDLWDVARYLANERNDLIKSRSQLEPKILSLPSLEDQEFLSAVRQGKHDLVILKALIYTALDQLSSRNLKQVFASISWLKDFINILLEKRTSYETELRVLVDLSADILSKTVLHRMHVSDLHPVPIWITYTQNRDHYDQCIGLKSSRRKLRKRKEDDVKGALRELSLHLSREINELQTCKRYRTEIYSSTHKPNTHVDTQDSYDQLICTQKNSRVNLHYLSMKYPMLALDKCITPVQKQQLSFMDTLWEKGQIEGLLGRHSLFAYNQSELVLRFALDQIVKEQSVIQLGDCDDLQAISIYSGDRLYEFLKSCRTYPDSFKAPYDIFIATCEHYYRTFHDEMLVKQRVSPNLSKVPSLEEVHESMLKDHSSYLSESVLMLWYSLFIELNVLGGTNKNYHSGLKEAIEDAGLEEVFLDEKGDFLTSYSAECLEKAMEQYLRRLVFNLGKSSETDEDGVEDDVENSLSEEHKSESP